MNIKWVGCDDSNYTKGRLGNSIDKIVLHWIVGTLESADATFANPERNASAHYGVGDSDIHQYVKDEDTAWHCGDWLWNLKTIGIEHEGGPDLPISEDTYKTSALLVKSLCEKYNIPIDREHITGHNEYQATQCPGNLKIDKIINLAKGGIMEWLKEDIPTEVEEKFGLKKIERYSKYWDFNELISDWVKICGELDKVKGEYENEVAELTEELEEGTRQYNILQSEKESLETKLEACERDMVEVTEKCELEVSVLEKQVEDISTKYEQLLKDYENIQDELDAGYAEQIKRLKKTIDDLEKRVLQLQRPTPSVGEAFELLIEAIKEVLTK